jgi:choline dehydrogenase
MSFTPDFIIVGGGSAGCVLANRLSCEAGIRVLLLEAGGPDRHFLYAMPAGFFPLMQSGRGNWNYQTVPQPGLDGRTMYFPRGRILGGSSSINGLVVSRGNASDYDHWAEMGSPGWSYGDCLPYFKRIERYPAGDPAFRGHSGPIGVTLSPIDTMNPVSRAWIDGAQQAGYPFNHDVNSANPFGVAQMQGSYAEGRRQSASACYLRPVLGRPNLRVVTNAYAVRVLLEGSRAVGIEYLQNGQLRIQHAQREVILSGGVINSPQLLQLSGIGDPRDLQPLGLAVRHELTGVGRNLSDHIAVSVKQLITKPYSLLSSQKPAAVVTALGRYMLWRSGPLTVSALEAWAHLMSRPDLQYPDLQIYAVPLMYNDHGRDVIGEEGFMAVMNGSRPNSVGTVVIRSSDPTVPPAIDPKYFSDVEDLRVLREGIRLTREIIAQKAYDGFRGAEYAPGDAIRSAADLNAYIRSTANTLYHPVGTCKMGSDDSAVVDPCLRVRGVEGLRVIDASVMPRITSGNTNFPSMMIAEKGADLILGRVLSPL